MVGGTTAAVTRLRPAVGAAVVVAAAVLGWALAFPQNSLGGTLIRAIADCSAVVTLGLTMVPMFDRPGTAPKSPSAPPTHSSSLRRSGRSRR